MSPGRSGSPAYGTSLASGTPDRAITISSPPAVREISCDSTLRASYVLYAASLFGLTRPTGLTGLTGLI
jgi:hypothetical protein